jgi:uncharacterized membrane protein
MNRLWEILLGLDKGFLNRPGDLSLQFNPDWPFQHYLDPIGGASFYNLMLVVWGLALVIYVYRREGRSTAMRIGLAAVRMALLLIVLILLNRPVLVLEQDRKEPSVVAVLVDDTLSMSVPDVAAAKRGQPPMTRLAAAQDLLAGDGAQLMRELSKVHDLKIYRLGPDAQPLVTVSAPEDVDAAAQRIWSMQATEDGTQVVQSLSTVLQDLQGQRLAGVVLLTDGKDVPMRERPELINELRSKFTVPVYSVPLGQDALPRTVEVMKPDYEPSAFLDDYTVVKFAVRGTGFEPNHKLTVTLKTKSDGKPVLDEKGNPVTAEVVLADERPVQVELSFMPALALRMDPHRLPATLPPEDRSLDLIVEADKQPGQINPADNIRDVSIQVLDTQISVLFVDGYPRWEYRYIKNTLVRDKTMKVNCLLTSADPSFVQEASDGVTPLMAFPATLEELLPFDVILFGDVDQHEFTDAQLQLINDFVSKRGGGFGMIAGPRYSPQSYKNTPIQPLLPVDISRTDVDDNEVPITEGFRPVLTAEGLSSSIFRFYADRDENRRYVQDLSPPLFWYCHGVTARPQATVLEEHPVDLAPGSPRKAPLLAVSQFGAGRTLFSAVDDSWRWRFYTGEYIFDSYWVQQVRYLARNRKLDERNVTFEMTQSEYQLGQQAGIDLNILNPRLAEEAPPQLPVDVLDASGRPVRRVMMNRLENSTKYTATWTADSLGRFVARLPPLGDGQAMDRPFSVKSPQLELESPRLDRSLLASLGQLVELPSARTELPNLIHSAARTIPIQFSRPVWEAPLALILFAGLITAEWVLRKLHGML